MESILNITNGDSTVEIMRQAAIPGEILPWRDVLHDGPVPAGLSLEELSAVRVQFIIDQGWGEPKTILSGFVDRDNTLCAYRKYAQVILWFEHDLYDQLQLLQILDWFADNPPDTTKLSIICTEQYLGLATPRQIQELIKHKERITDKHLILAKRAWAAFRAPSPDKWQQLLNHDTSILPFLEGAILRLLKEYPDCNSGLSRTAKQALDIIAKGEKRPGRIFARYQETEERRFMGDASFWSILQQFLTSTPALITLPPGKKLTLPTSPDQELTVTANGIKVLTGELNWLDIITIDHWIGGVHLTEENVWCRAPDSRIVKKPTYHGNRMQNAKVRN